MKLDLPMLLLYAAIIGVGVWVWGLFKGNGNGNGSTVTLTTTSSSSTDSEGHYGGASTGFGGVVNWVQDVTNADGWGSAAVDALQELGSQD
jgi:cytoskeletal protein RodZ